MSLLANQKSHSDRYDYSGSIYKQTYCKIIIACREHGEIGKN